MTLTQKETTLLQDIVSQEQLCIDKYEKYATQACDPQLKNLFTTLGNNEKQHLQTLNEILKGSVPSVPTSSKDSSQAAPETCCKYDTLDNSQEKKTDKYLCSDALAGEKHVSSVYNTGIFEFKDNQIRDTLNHIQKEEQQHGKAIYNYMSQNGMYQ